MAGVPSGYHEFAHIADGGGLTTTFLVSNPSSEFAEVDISFLKDDGSPWNLMIGGQANTVYRLNLPPGGMARLRSDGLGTIAFGGWARINASQEVGAQVLFEIEAGGKLVTQAAVESTGPVRNADLFVVRDSAAGSNTGIALAALTDHGATRVILTLVGTDGTVIQDGSFTLSGPHRHQAKFINEFFTGLGDVTGTLRVSASGPICITTLQQTGLVLGTLPPVVRTN
jgi:hypothetical protein